MKLAHVKEFKIYYWVCPYCNQVNSDNTDTSAYSDMVCRECGNFVKATHEEHEQGEEY